METFKIKCMDKEIEILLSTAEAIPAFKAYLSFTKNSEKPYFIEHPAEVFYEFLNVIHGRYNKISDQVFTLGDELAYWTFADGRTQKIEVWPYHVKESMTTYGLNYEILLLIPCKRKEFTNFCSNSNSNRSCCCIDVNENYIRVHGKFSFTVKTWCSECEKNVEQHYNGMGRECDKNPNRYYRVEKTLKTEFPRGVVVMPRSIHENYL